jgi:deazaflavin-dependent oxidoreductase (nitroreductase family)
LTVGAIISSPEVPNMLCVVSLAGFVLDVHERIYKASDGRVGHKLIGVPTLLLRTTGRRSGAIRTNGLVYARDGERYLIVPSNGGADRPPAWLHNLKANPAVEIQIGRERLAGTAEVIEPSDPSYERLWPVVNANNRDRYAAYQRRTSRPIPVVAITPS